MKLGDFISSVILGEREFSSSRSCFNTNPRIDPIHKNMNLFSSGDVVLVSNTKCDKNVIPRRNAAIVDVTLGGLSGSLYLEFS